MLGMVSVTVSLSGAVTEAEIQSAREYVHGLTGGTAKITRLSAHAVMVGAHGPSQAPALPQNSN